MTAATLRSMLTGGFLLGILAIANGYSWQVAGYVAVFGAGVGLSDDFAGVLARSESGRPMAPTSEASKTDDPSKRRLPL